MRNILDSATEWDVVRRRKAEKLRFLIASVAILGQYRLIIVSRTSQKEVFSMSNNTKKGRPNAKISTIRMAYLAVMVALAIITNVFEIPIPAGGIIGNKIGLTYVPTFLTGIFFGPFAGLGVGALGDSLGWLINSSTGAYNPIFTISTALMGFIAGCVFRIPKLHTVIKLIISLILAYIICSCFINTFATWFYYTPMSKTFWVFLVGRLPSSAINLAANTVVLFVLIPITKKLIPQKALVK